MRSRRSWPRIQEDIFSVNWFIGTGIFASLCLEGLTQHNITFNRIITGKPSGRTGHEQPSPVEQKALELGLTPERTGRLTENEELMRSLNDEAEKPEYVFVIDFGQIVREPLLSCMCLNLHPSLLPKYRGAAPVQRALLDGETSTGVTLFRLGGAMDAGDIIAQADIPIAPDDNASDLYPKLASLGCGIAAEALTRKLTFTPQDDSLATFAQKISREEHEASFAMTAEVFANTVRALDMSGGAFVVVSGRRLKLWRVRVRPDIMAGSPGEVLAIGEGVVVSCSDCGVELLEVQTEGRKRTNGAEWSRGMRLKTGHILCKV